jgi:hypothetical protein
MHRQPGSYNHGGNQKRGRADEPSAPLPAFVPPQPSTPRPEGGMNAAPAQLPPPPPPAMGGLQVQHGAAGGGQHVEPAPEEYYRELCDDINGLMPRGWERITIGGSSHVYLDHVSREAYENPPWEIWQRQAAATAI